MPHTSLYILDNQTNKTDIAKMAHRGQCHHAVDDLQQPNLESHHPTCSSNDNPAPAFFQQRLPPCQPDEEGGQHQHREVSLELALEELR